MNVEEIGSSVPHILTRLACLLTLTLMIPACSSQLATFIPPAMQQQIDWTLSFDQIKESPSTYQGAVVVVGGEVLTAKRFRDHTRIIILQLPLSSGHEPVTNRTQSEGRFIARKEEFLDPATLPPGTRVTVIGEISGSTTELLDEMEYTYPVLIIKHIEVWPPPQHLPYYYYGPYYGPYYPYGGAGRYYGRFGGVYGPYYPYPYYWY